MKPVTDVQAVIIGQLQQLLAQVPLFGEAVREGSAKSIFDAEDSASEPSRQIILQDGDTVETARTPGQMSEEWTINIIAISRERGDAEALRAARLAIKRALKGIKGGVDAPGLIKASFPPSAGQLPGPGRRWGFRVVPITFHYTQQL